MVRSIAVALFVGVATWGSTYLAQTYWSAVFGTPDAQWQMSFVMAPIPIVLAVIGLLIAYFPRPRLHKVFIVGSWIAVTIPAACLVLVMSHLY
jgi:hypothetical protein